MGERIGFVRDGVTNRTDVAYETADGTEWRVTTQTVVGPHTNAVTTTRERLTGLSGALRSMTITVGADGIATTAVSYDVATLVETETAASSVESPVVTRRIHGLVLEEETAEEITAYTYDAFGRVVKVERRRPGETEFTPVAESAYTAGNSWQLAYSANCTLTNEVFTSLRLCDSARETNALARLVDAYSRPAGYDLTIGATPRSRMRYGYDTEGRIATLAATPD